MGRLADALAAAKRCGSTQAIAAQLAFQGKFEEASRLHERTNAYLATTIAIAPDNGWRPPGMPRRWRMRSSADPRFGLHRRRRARRRR